MIDIEADVFDAVYDAMSEVVPVGNFVSELDLAPASLPHVTLYERINVLDRRMQTQSLEQQFAILGFEGVIDANDRTECRRIAAVLDTAMTRINFLPDGNGADFDVQESDVRFVRMVRRYIAKTDGTNIYRA